VHDRVMGRLKQFKTLVYGGTGDSALFCSLTVCQI